MNDRLKSFAKAWLPPALQKKFIQSSRRTIQFDGAYLSWEQAAAESSGYDHSVILGRVRAAALKVKNGEAVFERDSVLFDKIHYAWPALAGLLWAAARDGGRLSVMDFGGSLGSSYFQNRAFLAKIPSVSWGIVEQRHYVECGRAEIQERSLQFFEDVEACVEAIGPNVVLLGSVLQYLPAYQDVLQQLVACRPAVVILDRTIMNAGSSDTIHIQTVPASIYAASYPCRSISESGLVRYLDGLGYGLVANFECDTPPALDRIGSAFKGYIFSRKAD